jgi:hypothetical protein
MDGARRPEIGVIGVVRRLVDRLAAANTYLAVPRWRPRR